MKETKFKPGDKVRVKSDLIADEVTMYSMENSSDSNVVAEAMAHLIGKEVTIRTANSGGYHLVEDDNYWNWTDEMFEEIVPEYVECIYNNGTFAGKLTVGHIYKVSSITNYNTFNEYVHIEGFTGGIYRGLNVTSEGTNYSAYTGFKPSTKEAYEAQFKPVIPEYVKCISWYGNMYVTGKVYKVVDGRVTQENGSLDNSSRWNHTSFKPSTKAEFDAQFKPTFEEGCWYSMHGGTEVLYGGENAWFVKSPKIGKDDTITCDSYIFTGSNGEKFNAGGNLGKVFQYTYKKIDTDIIQQYLPEGHVDKIKPKEWGVGTYVVFLEDYGGYPKGTIDTITNPTYMHSVVQVSLPFNGDISDPCNLTRETECKWFATRAEAEVFSKELLTPKTFVLGGYDVTVTRDVVKIGCTSLDRNKVVRFLNDFTTFVNTFGSGTNYFVINDTKVDFTKACALLDYINKH